MAHLKIKTIIMLLLIIIVTNTITFNIMARNSRFNRLDMINQDLKAFMNDKEYDVDEYNCVNIAQDFIDDTRRKHNITLTYEDRYKKSNHSELHRVVVIHVDPKLGDIIPFIDDYEVER